ncbi:MAG: succinate--CoA ligase subunit alpha [Dehalococcoidia bacterium]|nr:succinate--CoA ligase subunit alpha [Dehalococcoidia bacterium]|tara:strand:+ start:2521 stop:3399 length:879 start_codon:yes stop_codon:yes gene_type:complete
MSILVDTNSRIVVQGITGKEGSFHAQRCIDFGTNVVAGVTPGKGSTLFMDSVPIFDTLEQAVEKTQPNVSIIFVPAPFAPDAILEAAENEIPLIICITEGLPVQDTIRVVRYIERKPVRLLGPNCPGIISPGDKCKVGIMPASIHKAGKVGVVSRSGTLTYETVQQLSELGIGQSTCVGIGGDPVSGTTFADILEMFQNDPETDAVVLIGEIGGTKEQLAADYIKNNFKKPIASLIVGQTAPKGKRMGHAGAVVTGPAALASEKIAALRDAGAFIINTPSEIGATVEKMLNT